MQHVDLQFDSGGQVFFGDARQIDGANDDFVARQQDGGGKMRFACFFEQAEQFGAPLGGGPEAEIAEGGFGQ